MKQTKSNHDVAVEEGQRSCEIMVLRDGRILAHNITPALAALLAAIDPADPAIRSRATMMKKENANETAPGN